MLKTRSRSELTHQVGSGSGYEINRTATLSLTIVPIYQQPAQGSQFWRHIEAVHWWITAMANSAQAEKEGKAAKSSRWIVRMVHQVKEFNVNECFITRTTTRIPDQKVSITDPDPQMENQEFRIHILQSKSGVIHPDPGRNPSNYGSRSMMPNNYGTDWIRIPNTI